MQIKCFSSNLYKNIIADIWDLCTILKPHSEKKCKFDRKLTIEINERTQPIHNISKRI